MSEDKETIFGKRILVGLTYLKADGCIDRQVQIHGLITKLTENTLIFDRANGEGEFTIPFDGQLEEAEPEATYTLKSTGETVENVHFISSWTISPPK